jgi:hypothetical protein
LSRSSPIRSFRLPIQERALGSKGLRPCYAPVGSRGWIQI